jgi:ketosteroid isomerase-like protein
MSNMNFPHQSEHPSGETPRDPGESPPPATVRSDRRVQEASEESFPASDPPSYMGAHSPEQVSHEHESFERQWAHRFVRAFDKEELDVMDELLTEDAIVRIGDASVLTGRAAARRWFTQWFASVGPTSRQIIDARGDDEALFIELEVTGQTADGRTLSWPEAVSVRLRGECASRLTVYGARAGSTTLREPDAPGEPAP